jgi:predicted lipid carrier protein YhbT
MTHHPRHLIEKAAFTAIAAVLMTPLAKPQTASAGDRWLHVRVSNLDSKEETVRVNVPLELAEKVLPTVNQDRLQHGRVKIDQIDCHGVDLHALVDAVHSSKDGEFVTVQNKDSDVRVAKQNGYLLVHVFDKKAPKNSQVEVKMPMKVVDALFSGGKDELDLVAALHALSTQGDTELVTVKDKENSVRVWLDSKNGSD